MSIKNRFKEIELVVFDVDGTLYSQQKLRRIIFIKLCKYYVVRPWKFYDLFIIYHFRKEREKKAGYVGHNLEVEQYEWCAIKTRQPIKKIKAVINKWIFEIPNAYLYKCVYPGAVQYINDLKVNGVKTAVYSDYKSEEKLKSMHIDVDMQISSTDQSVNSFKPLPRGLLVVLQNMDISNKSNCLYIGDRYELDGLCAERAGIPFLIVDKSTVKTSFYFERSMELNDSRN